MRMKEVDGESDYDSNAMSGFEFSNQISGVEKY